MMPVVNDLPAKNNVREFATELGYTIPSLARAMRISELTAYNITNGTTLPTFKNQAMLAKILNKSPMEIWPEAYESVNNLILWEALKK